MAPHKLFIDGNWEDSPDLRPIRSPFDGGVVGEVFFASRSQVEMAIGAAHEAFSATRRLASFERSRVLEAVSDEIGRRREEFARSIAFQAGKPIRDSRVEVDRAVNTFRIASEEAKRLGGEIVPLDIIPAARDRWGLVRRFPLGPIAAIPPFNFPLNLVAHKVAPALAVGNTVILRPSSQVAITSLLLAEVISGTDYPAGGFNAVPAGYAESEPLLDDERVKMLTFTGSPAIGWELKKRANRKKVTLELGGNAAVVMEPDADLEYALPRIVTGSFAYAGQVCISIQRLFLHEKIYDRFMSDFLDRTKKLKVGDPLDEATDVGPMIDEGAARRIEDWLGRAVAEGARVLCGGKRTGTMVEPAVLEKVKPELPISWLEAFAPVVVVSPYKDFGAALEAVNDSIYGLQAGVFTRDLAKVFQAYDALEVGGVIINDIPTFRVDHMPYGGIKESGFGREGVRYAMEEMTELKLLAVNPK
jgi:acyl-CoA reductase-like NAD-dependent aldehyde dehydrogenase